MKKNTKRYLPFLEQEVIGKPNPALLRIIVSDDHVRVDFGYVASEQYDCGGWIRMAPYTYIRVHGRAEKYGLKEARNIPLAPEQHHFESTQDWRVFSLFFAPIPLVDCTLDIIEEENPTPNDFNYYGIRLTRVKERELWHSIG